MTSCKDDEDLSPELATARIESLEIGSGNNGKGVIGRDFHFDMDVVAATRIEDIQIGIKQQAEKTYLKECSFELAWEEFKGTKNANVHKHFNIPKEAPEVSTTFSFASMMKTGV